MRDTGMFAEKADLQLLEKAGKLREQGGSARSESVAVFVVAKSSYQVPGIQQVVEFLVAYDLFVLVDIDMGFRQVRRAVIVALAVRSQKTGRCLGALEGYEDADRGTIA
jgi:hypothetical protein